MASFQALFARFATGGEETVESGVRARLGPRIFEKARGMVITEHDRVEIVRELLGVGVGAELSFARFRL